jgi:hypothetical protein
MSKKNGGILNDAMAMKSILHEKAKEIFLSY